MNLYRLPAAVELLVLASLLAACDGFGAGCSGGCDGGVAIDGLRLGADVGFPRAEVLPSAAGLTLTDEGFTVLEERGLDLLATLLDASADRLDLSDFVNDFLAENPIELFSWSVREVEVIATLPDGPDSLALTVLSDPTRLRLEISRLWVSIRATVFDDQGAVTAACRIAPEADPGGDALQSLVFEDIVIDVILGTTSDGHLAISTDVISLGLEETGIHIVDDEADPDFYCRIFECTDGCFECELFCGGGEILLDLGSFFTELFSDLVGELAEQVVNRLLEGVEAVEGELHPALFLGDLMPSSHDAEWLQFRLAPGRDGFAALPIAGVDPNTANDLFLSFAGGTYADVHPCVVKTEGEPTWLPPEPYRVEAGETRPHLTLSLADTFIDQALWSAYKAGMLCLAIDSQGVAGLTDAITLDAGLLSLLLPALDTLAEPDAPLLITLRPSLSHDDFPLVRLGRPDADESLIAVNLGAVDIGLYAWVQGRYLRLFEVRTRINAGITPTILPDNRLELAIDSLDAALESEVYNELFQGVQLTELVNFVLELATDLIAEGSLDFTLPLDDLLSNLLGLPVRLVVDRLTATGPADRWLELGVRLEDTAASAVHRAPVETEVVLRASAPDHVLLEVSAPGYRPEQIEFQVRWGFGAWSGFVPATETRVESRYLSVRGPHTLEVRARAVGDYRSLDVRGAAMRVEGASQPVSSARPPPRAPPAAGEPEAATVDGLACGQVSGTRPPTLGLLVVLALAWRVRRRAR